MYAYWDSTRPQKQASSSGLRKVMAMLIVVMILLSFALIFVMQFINLGGGASVRVGVLDSGVDSTVTLQGRVVAGKSFISTTYGYSATDTSTSDSSPEGVTHGTLVATQVAISSSNALIVNAKVIANDGVAQTPGIVAAIYWAVEQNCSVINLSLGGTPTYGDPLREAVRYAFSQGVVVVASAGNEGNDGVAGNSVGSPALYEYALAVGAVDEFGSLASYSSYGPTAGRAIKPDIVAPGYVETTNAVYYGTSFSSPRVAAAAADLVALCKNRGIEWNPGLIMVALMAGAQAMAYPEYLVGAGLLDVAHSRTLIEQAISGGDASSMTYVRPASLPMDFEKLFFGDRYEFNAQVLTAALNTYEVGVVSDKAEAFDIPAQVSINQTGFVPISIQLPPSGTSHFEANITLSLDGIDQGAILVDFIAATPSARIAFDISHTTWAMDTTYGQFKELYLKLVENDISVTELRNASATTPDLLSNFDAVFILDPCVWDINETDAYEPKTFSLPFSQAEIDAYSAYFDGGGGIFVASLSNDSADVSSINDFLAWSGFAFGFSTIETASSDPVLVHEIVGHPITTGVASFDYLGAPITVPVGATILATYNAQDVLGCFEGPGGGRIVVTGTNFFVDNYGMRQQYTSNYDGTLALKIALWICGLI